LHNAVVECEAATAGLVLGAVGREKFELQHGSDCKKPDGTVLFVVKDLFKAFQQQAIEGEKVKVLPQHCNESHIAI